MAACTVEWEENGLRGKTCGLQHRIWCFDRLPPQATLDGVQLRQVQRTYFVSLIMTFQLGKNIEMGQICQPSYSFNRRKKKNSKPDSL